MRYDKGLWVYRLHKTQQERRCSMIKNLKLRLNLDVEAERRVYDHLQNSERSISKEAIRSINDYLDLIEERKNERTRKDFLTVLPLRFRTIWKCSRLCWICLHSLSLLHNRSRLSLFRRKKTVPLKKICLNFSIAFRRHFCCQKTANYQAICHRFYYTVQIPIFPATFVERLTAHLSPRYLRLLRQRYTKYKTKLNGWKYHSVAVSYTVASREFVRQIPDTTAQKLL